MQTNEELERHLWMMGWPEMAAKIGELDDHEAAEAGREEAAVELEDRATRAESALEEVRQALETLGSQLKVEGRDAVAEVVTRFLDTPEAVNFEVELDRALSDER